jgi:hypothetical protein
MRHFVSVSLLLLAAAPFYQAATVSDPPPPPIAAKFLDLFDRLRTAQAKTEEGKHHLVTFLLSESDINEYLRYSLKTTPRPGLDSLTVKVFGKDYVATFARVDFDALERWHPGTIPAALHPVLKGKKAIQIDFRLHADNSTMTFTVEKGRYDDVPLPAAFVEKMIQLVAARQPEKYDTSKPLPLPFGLRKVWTNEQTIQGHN